MKIRRWKILGMVFIVFFMVGCSKKDQKDVSKEQPVKTNPLKIETSSENVLKPQAAVDVQDKEEQASFETCEQGGLQTEGICQFCQDIPGAICLVLGQTSGGEKCYSCVEKPEVEEEPQAEPEVMVEVEGEPEPQPQPQPEPEPEVTMEIEVEPEVMVEVEVEPEVMVEVEIEPVPEPEPELIIQEVQEVVQTPAHTYVSADVCDTYDLSSLSQCNDSCNGNCVAEEVNEAEGFCFRCESARGEGGCESIGFHTDCSSCQETEACRFLEMVVLTTNMLNYQTQCYQCF